LTVIEDVMRYEVAAATISTARAAIAVPVVNGHSPLTILTITPVVSTIGVRLVGFPIRAFRAAFGES
jgi:hypothetical protein